MYLNRIFCCNCPITKRQKESGLGRFCVPVKSFREETGSWLSVWAGRQPGSILYINHNTHITIRLSCVPVMVFRGATGSWLQVWAGRQPEIIPPRRKSDLTLKGAFFIMWVMYFCKRKLVWKPLDYRTRGFNKAAICTRRGRSNSDKVVITSTGCNSSESRPGSKAHSVISCLLTRWHMTSKLQDSAAFAPFTDSEPSAAAERAVAGNNNHALEPQATNLRDETNCLCL